MQVQVMDGIDGNIIVIIQSIGNTCNVSVVQGRVVTALVR